MTVHFVSLKGMRPSNEDAHKINLNLTKKNKNEAQINFYLCSDGHGSSFVSKYLSENLFNYFNDKCVKYPLDIDYVNKVYDKLQNDLIKNHNNEALNSGATCVVVFQYKVKHKDYIDILNTGDSRVVLCRNNIGIPLTIDHKPENPIEKRRIKKLGGVVRKDGDVYRIADLSVSRAFGDIHASKYVTHKPDYFSYKLSKNDKFICIACDGLWDVFNSQSLVDYILNNFYDENMKRIKSEINIARRVSEYAIRSLGSSDNVSCIVVFFD